MNKLKSLLTEGDPEAVYSLDDEIASGAFGTVYRGVMVATKQPVAIKICEPTEDETMEDLLIEVSVLKQCSHPNIIQFFGAYKKGNELFVRLCYCQVFCTRPYFSSLKDCSRTLRRLEALVS